MWMKRGGRAMPFRATQEFAVAEVSLLLAGTLSARAARLARGRSTPSRPARAPSERTTVGSAPGDAQRGADDERGRGDAVSRGARLGRRMRLSVISPLEWRPAGEDAVDVTTRVGDGAISVQLRFDASGTSPRVAAGAAAPSWQADGGDARGAAASATTTWSAASASRPGAGVYWDRPRRAVSVLQRHGHARLELG